MRLDLILLMRDIYINLSLNSLTKFISSNISIEFKDILPWNISQMIMKTIPIGASRCEYDGLSMKTKTTKWSIFLNEGKAIAKQILASEERKKSKRAGL